MLKLIWTLVVIVLLVGVMRLVMLHSANQSPDQRIIMQKSK